MTDNTTSTTTRHADTCGGCLPTPSGAGVYAGRHLASAFQPTTGDFVSEVLVTDTLTYEVVGTTPTGIRIRRTKDGDTLTSENVDGNPYPVVRVEQVPDVDAPVRLIRRRKDGTFRTGQGANPMRAATFVEGKPVRRIDYRY